MLILLLAFNFLSTVLIFISLEPGQRLCLRDAFIKSSIIYGILIVVLTEALSFNHSLETSSVASFWSLLLALNTALVGLKFKRRSLQPLKLQTLNWRFFDCDNLISIFTVFSVLGLTLATALIAAPNNWDAMTYHLPRVMHWLQNQTVAYYPTNNIRQISLPPGTGYLVAQLQILARSDRFASCVQWLAFLGIIGGTSLVAEKLTHDAAKWLTMLVCASLPMAIMQATTPQTDLTLTYWLVCLVYFIFTKKDYKAHDYFWISASLGLSILAKPTAFVFGFPLMVILLVRNLAYKTLKYPTTLKKVISQFGSTALNFILISVASLSLSLPSYWRNYLLFDSWMGPEFGTRNEVLGVPQIFSNILKYLAINLPIPGFWQLTAFIHQSVLQVDVDDPRLNYSPTPLAGDVSQLPLALLKILAPHEDYVGNPIHLLLIILGWLILIFGCKNLSRGTKILDLLMLSIANLVSFLSFCLLLKWQVWGNRLLLPLFVLNVPLITYCLHRIAPLKLRRAFLVLLAFMAILYALTPMRHPLLALPNRSDEQSASILTLSRSEVYFSGARKELQAPYRAAIALIQKHQCRSVGLALGGDDWEYPLWVLMEEQSSSSFQMKSVEVKNESRLAPPEFPDEQLCTVLSTIPTYQPQNLGAQNLAWQEQVISETPFVKVFVSNVGKQNSLS
ncbi:glycosyltransferase family 39 protein [Trichocoleus sp. FACHB-262]|uniref:glycosyltransferase family 39 protein n=1 Tax=Trichocoleus sp. FACHB-262 TaxID=2692869 RepID=UPI0016885334|nr:glycosyltransferase family 39 protein [Trichocoleus sp. FACHB-262]MBD2121276.1 glycosyltransferase family 39 protein [Trichocoleus sp. FACHB-262]